MGTTNPISCAAIAPAKRRWRRHNDAFKARVIELARQPHTSVAAVALANGLNANMLRRWVREAQAPSSASTNAAPKFVQSPMPPQSTPAAPPSTATGTEPSDRIFVEVHRGDTTVHVTRPVDVNTAAWVREVLW